MPTITKPKSKTKAQTSSTTQMLATLAKYDTPTICNIIELFNIRPRNRGYMDGRIKAAFPNFPPMVGYACTTTFRADGPAQGPDAYRGLGDQIERFAELPGPAVVVFQDLDDPAVAATFGEMMCGTYQKFGAAGLVTSGGGRDLLQVEAIKFPVFTGGTICSHGFTHFTSVGEPVRVGGIMIYQGDLLHGDANGVTTIPTEIASEVADMASKFVDAEAILLNYLKNEKNPTPANLKPCLAEVGAALTKLRQQVARK